MFYQDVKGGGVSGGAKVIFNSYARAAVSGSQSNQWHGFIMWCWLQYGNTEKKLQESLLCPCVMNEAFGLNLGCSGDLSATDSSGVKGDLQLPRKGSTFLFPCWTLKMREICLHLRALLLLGFYDPGTLSVSGDLSTSLTIQALVQMNLQAGEWSMAGSAWTLWLKEWLGH